MKRLSFMGRLNHIPISAALILSSIAAHAAGDYSVIIERKPFGEFSSAGRPSRSGQAETRQDQTAQMLSRQLSLVAVNVTPLGVPVAGIIDKSSGKSREFYLSAGQSEGGISVLSVDAAMETASIEKDGVPLTLKLGKGVVENTSSPPQAGSPQPSTDGREASSAAPGALRPGFNPAIPRPIHGSYRERVRQRRLAELQAINSAKTREESERKSLAENAARDAAARREREINLDLISRGEEPISPIALTPDEEADLVGRGVLPKQ